MAEKKIRRIKERPAIHKVEPSNRIKRVAVYARVSTQHDNQQSSFVAQQDYYSKMVRNRLDWELVNIYSDSGISGTSIKRRLGFEGMMNDARNGNMDLIITKSVSRFARNTVDSLNAIRELKELGIEVYFEKESVWTFDSKGEMLITLLSCLAQEESRNLSENVAWGHRKKFADGRFSLAYGQFLGYDKGQEYALEINKEQAETVREIYRLFLLGKSYHGIADILTKRKIPTPGGKTKWGQAVVKSILTNEKYKGDALLQKSYIVDFLTKKSKKNEGELPQYYVKESHEAIIEPELFDYVQEEVKRRDSSESRYSGVTALSSRVICGECGRAYGPRPWHSTTYNQRVWQCPNRSYGHKCNNINIHEDLLQEIVSTGIKMLMADNLDVIDTCKDILRQHVGDQKASCVEGWISFKNNDINDSVHMICSIIIKAERTVEIESICGSKRLIRLPEGNVTGKMRAVLGIYGK